MLQLLCMRTGVEKIIKWMTDGGNQVYCWSGRLQVSMREGLSEPCGTGLQLETLVRTRV